MTRLFIAIPVHNRLTIAEKCIPTVTVSKAPEDVLAIYDDGSEDAERARQLSVYADMLTQFGECKGIEEQRRIHFREFWARRDDFTHFYLTDSDAPHDPAWREHALYLQEVSGGLPVCLYNTDAHVRLQGNTVEDLSAKPYIIRRVAPGISYLLTREHVERVMRHIELLNHWDWMVPALLKHRMCVARVSHVSHVGVGGLHHGDNPIDGGDVPLNPTPWLVAKRKEIIESLTP
jgi:hypothetical protein